MLRGRKCLSLGGSVTSFGLAKEDNLPKWLDQIMEIVHSRFLTSFGLPAPNHALINVYDPGEGIMSHEDGPAYTPFAVILSLGASTVIDFVPKAKDERLSAQVYLPVGSLLFFCDDAYTEMLHGIRFDRSDHISRHVLNADEIKRCGLSKFSNDLLIRGKRISITMRHVPLVYFIFFFISVQTTCMPKFTARVAIYVFNIS